MSQTITEDTAALLEGRYQLLDCIGSGGMASVYRAMDVMLGRTVAIKMVRAGLEGASLRAARSETAVLASLSHPGLVTLFDAHLTPGRPEFLVMELVDGPTLGDRLHRGPLDSREVAQLGSELADALHVVHAAGIVHRDVKPSNVLLAPSSTPGRSFRAKLADFGVAFLLGEARVTAPGMVIGTLGYLSPEQLRGEAPTPASDVYALGLVLLEALTGTRVFPSHGAAEALAARHAGPVEIPASVPQEWADLLRGMTDDDPEARPSALVVAQETQQLATRSDLALAPVVERPPTAATTAVLPVGTGETAPARIAPGERRMRAVAVLSGLAAVAAIGAGVWIGAVADETPVATRIWPAIDGPATVKQPAGAPDAVVDPGVTQQQGDVAPADTGGQAPLVDDREAEKKAEEALKEQQKAQRDQAKKAEEAQKEQQKAAEKAQRDQAKKAEEAQKKAEEARKKAEEARNQGDGEEGSDD